MRVITGSARGRKLISLPGTDTRPTADHVKEGIFNAIQFDLEGRRILDLFAGSGQLGIEALSRGAQSAVFVDSGRGAVDVVRQNLSATGFSACSTVLCTDSIAYLSGRSEPFDIVFLDPPYASDLLQKALDAAAKKAHSGCVIVCEHPFSDSPPVKPDGFLPGKTYRYGKIAVTIFRKEELII